VIRYGDGCVDLPGADPNLDDEGYEFQDVDVRVVRVNIAAVVLWVCPLAWFVGKATGVKVPKC
jgi:hypothetical protein